MSSERNRLKPKIWALVICLLGFGLLVYRLDEKSLWGDEEFNAEVVRADSKLLLTAVAGVGHPPFLFLCQSTWQTFGGDSEFALRYPSVIFGLLSIAMLYALGTRMMNKRVGLMAMSLMAISPFFVMYSRMARYYSLLLLLSLTSYWFFNRLLEDSRTRREWIGYIVSSTLGVYTHYLFAAVLVAQAVIALSRIKHRRWFALQFFGSQMVVFLLFAPWLGVMTRHAVERQAWPDAFGRSSLTMWVLSAVYPFFAWIVGETLYPWNPLALVGAILGVWLALRGLLSASKRANRGVAQDMVSENTAGNHVVDKRTLVPELYVRSFWRSRILGFAVFILLPLFLAIVIVRQFDSGASFQGVPSKAIFCVPFIYLLIGSGICTIAGSSRRLLVVAVLGIVLGLSLTNYYLGREFHNPIYVLQTEALANSISQQAESDDVLVSDYMTVFGYYVERKNPEAVHFFATNPQAAKNYIEEHQSARVWLVLLCRAVETESLATVELVPWLLNEGYAHELTLGYGPLDATYARVQELILRGPACRYKVVVHRYVQLH